MTTSKNARRMSAALISADAGFRDWLQGALAATGQEVEISIEILAPFQEVGADQLKRLRLADPQLIFLDLENDPRLGIRLAQFLSESHPGWRFIAAGHSLAPELLLAAMQAGVNEYLAKPLSEEALAAALGRLERKMGRAGEGADREPGRVMAFFGSKGGAGNTSVATNLAIQLHRLTGKNTLLVDLDLELGEIALFLGVQPRFNLVDMVRNFHRMDAELLASYIERHESGVHLLSAPYQPERAESVSGEQIRKILHFLKQHYDYVVVDTSKSFSTPTLATFEQADEIYMVATVDLPSLRNIKRSIPLVDRITGNGRERVRLLVNRYHPNNSISLQEAERTLEMPVYWRLANDYEAVMGAINSGQPVVLGNSPFANDIKGLAAKIAGLEPSTNGKGKFGPLKKLLRRQEAATHG